MDIRCRKSGCRYNKGQTCMAKYVGIDTHTKCESFVRGGEDKDYSRLMFESAPEFAPTRHIRTVNLRCQQRDCLFNDKGGCSANGITVTVLDEQNRPQCGTFILDAK